ncbi:hypothetical protein ASG87_06125 [Frateuria sp. Soil773]|nr:hypothetical protein ASG87_06125 [Frateuria sp. Soil773]
MTLLMVAGLAVGAGTSAATQTVVDSLGADPVPSRRGQLFHIELGTLAPGHAHKDGKAANGELLNFDTALQILRASRYPLSPLALSNVSLPPTGQERYPRRANALIATSAVFHTFDIGFREGRAWSKDADTDPTFQVVISDELARRLFGEGSAVGRIISVAGHSLSIVGVARDWQPQPRFYASDLGGDPFGSAIDIYVPLSVARAMAMQPRQLECTGGETSPQASTCAWLSLWTILEDSGQQRGFRDFLARFVSQQNSLGASLDPATAAVTPLVKWLASHSAVPDEASTQRWLALVFLIVGIVNSIALLLAKFMRRSGETSLRRALGARRADVFAQLMIESAVVGLAAGLVGAFIAWASLMAIAAQPSRYAHLIGIGVTTLGWCIVFSIGAAVLAALLPAWRACRISPAGNLKLL